jgi:hypothetical protein
MALLPTAIRQVAAKPGKSLVDTLDFAEARNHLTNLRIEVCLWLAPVSPKETIGTIIWYEKGMDLDSPKYTTQVIN